MCKFKTTCSEIIIIKNSKYFNLINILNDGNCNYAILDIKESVTYNSKYSVKIKSINNYNDTECIKEISAKNYFERIKLKYTLKLLWLQKEENIRYLVNLLFLSVGVYIGLKNK